MDDDITDPNEWNDLYDKVDRQLRAYITAVILGDEDAKDEIFLFLTETASRPDMIAAMLGTWFNMTRWLIQEYSGVETHGQLLELWVEISRDIEFEILENGTEDGT